MSEPTELRKRLGLELDRARDLAGVSTHQMAKRLREEGVKISQPTVLRIDGGRGRPLSMRAIGLWLDECGADDDTRARVLALAETVHGEMKSWASLLAGEQHLQGRMLDQDAAANHIQNFQPTVLPGLLQTASYAHAALNLGRTDVPSAVAGRLKRQELLNEPGRRFEFVVAERLLRHGPLPGALAGQSDRLLELSNLATVELAILPDDIYPGVLVYQNFVIRRSSTGKPWVAIELQHGAQEIRDPDSVQDYEEAWATLWEASAHGDDALDLIRKVF